MSEESRGLTELSAEQYRTLIEETSDIISVVDEDGTVLYQSPNSEHVKGWSRKELLGENILDYIHPDDRERVTDAFRALSNGDDVEEEVEFRLEQKNGEWIWLATTGTVPDPDSPIDGYITTSRNITERKETEQKLKSQRDDLELLNQVVRHDIRNDLQVVSTYAELLEEHVDEAGQKHLERLKESNEQAAELTITARDLTDVILRSEVELEPVPLKSVIDSEISEIQPAHADATFTVDQSLTELSVLADEMLNTVFRNLLKNAVQHNDKEQPEVRITAEEDGDTVLVRVRDNGPGVPDSQKETIFGKEEKGLESEGTGIGLYLVREIVTGYGGEIWVEDPEDRNDGAVFVLELERA
ncbi:PAS domain S-box protein [Halovenus sp. WSH3]|uniref:histidine kinase n=1 Tax=Halovenus carboxidivorans TaxID=2692199 RepID=A0A6B0T341_9EURY|nr:PAS domain-containing sensor histidine kinase [Halovenus carboxidivorans]MXR52455.1 PAS domain S-box protein [Halovenus carboxidivorans]